MVNLNNKQDYPHLTMMVKLMDTILFFLNATIVPFHSYPSLSYEIMQFIKNWFNADLTFITFTRWEVDKY